MSDVSLQLEWYRDSKGYRVVEHRGWGSWIVGNGGPPIRYRPFEANDAPVLAFARVDSPTALSNFASHFGYLSSVGYTDDGQPDPPVRAVVTYDEEHGLAAKESAPDLIGENVDDLLRAAALFKTVLTRTGSGRFSPSAYSQLSNLLWEYGPDDHAQFFVHLDPKFGFHHVLRAKDLISGMLVRLTQIAGKSSFKTCQLPRCGSLFEAGGSSGRRKDAKYCSDSHRIESNSRNRAKGH